MSNLVLEQAAACRRAGASSRRRRSRRRPASTGSRSASASTASSRATTRRTTAGCSSASARTAQNTPGTSTPTSSATKRIVDFSLDYGLPGKPGYEYTRPFDYFTFQATASSANGFENVHDARPAGRHGLRGRHATTAACWGLYGSYDYIAPQIFRVSSTALSLGTTAEWWLTDDRCRCRAPGMAGVGYAAVGTVERNRRTRPRLQLRRRAAGAARAARHLSATGRRSTSPAASTSSAGRLAGNRRRPRQHRPARRGAHVARPQAARGLDPVPRQPARRELPDGSAAHAARARPSASSTRCSARTASARLRTDGRRLPR